MTEKELRQKVVKKAQSWIGKAENDGSHRAIIDVYNTIQPLPRNYRMTYYDPWCAAFVSAVGQACDMTDIIFPECGCGPMVELYKKAGRWMENDAYVPKPGDVIFYDWQDSGVGDCTGEPDHVGLVENVTGNTVWIIEGNYSDMVYETHRPVNSINIRGYGLPDYAGKADEEEPEVIVIDDPDEKPKTCMVELPVLMIGDSSEAVRAVQIMLEKRGFKCGWMGADGEFGPKTESAAGKFQLAYDLPRDGIIDGDDYYVLIVGVKKHG